MTQIRYEDTMKYRSLDNPFHVLENPRGRYSVAVTVTRLPSGGYQIVPTPQNQMTENHRSNSISRFVSRFFSCCNSNEE